MSKDLHVHRDRLISLIERVERLKDNAFAPTKEASDILLLKEMKSILAEIKSSRLATNQKIHYLYNKLSSEIGEAEAKKLLHQHTHIIEAIGLKKLT